MAEIATQDLYARLRALKTRTPKRVLALYWAAAYPWYQMWQSHSFDLGTAFVCACISAPLLIVGSILKDHYNDDIQKKRNILTEQVLTQISLSDAIPFFLYLRPFETSHVLKESEINPFEFDTTQNFEQVLANKLTYFGPLLCLGNDSMAIGAVRRLTPEKD